MSDSNGSNLVLSFEPEALERCFVAADVLDDVYDQPHLEYALLGLAAQSRPFHVVATLLLAGQDVSVGGVYQSGHNVLSMRHEIIALSKHLKVPLVPVAFVHRHPGACQPSIIDDEFLIGVFLDQTSTVVSLKETRTVSADDPHYACLDGRKARQRSDPNSARRMKREVEFSIAFSLIVNKGRDHYLYAVRKERCRFCSEDRIRFVPAKLAVSPDRALSQQERNQIRVELKSEVAAKLRFEGSTLNVGVDR